MKTKKIFYTLALTTLLTTGAVEAQAQVSPGGEGGQFTPPRSYSTPEYTAFYGLFKFFVGPALGLPVIVNPLPAPYLQPKPEQKQPPIKPTPSPGTPGIFGY